MKTKIVLFIGLFIFFSPFYQQAMAADPHSSMIEDGPRVILITGANRGIGLAIARQLKKEGYTLSLGVRDLASIPADLADCDTHVYEAKDAQNVIDWVQHCKEKFGVIHGVIHSAGLLKLWTMSDSDEKTFDELMDVNAKGTFRLTRAVMPELKKTGDGRLIVLVSMAAKRILNQATYEKRIGYAASKQAQLALCKGAQIEGYHSGVRVCAICTSWVNTDMIKLISADLDPKVMSQPEDIANIVSMTLKLPNNAILDEILVNYKL